MSEEISRGEMKEFIQDIKTEVENAGKAFICLNEEYVKLVNQKKELKTDLVWIERQLDAAQSCFDDDYAHGAMVFMFKIREKVKELILK